MQYLVVALFNSAILMIIVAFCERARRRRACLRQRQRRLLLEAMRHDFARIAAAEPPIEECVASEVPV